MFTKRLPELDEAQPGVRDVLQLPYPDFVAFLGQENTPPGASRTIDEWIIHASITRDSRVLDLACSTGFSGREVHAVTRADIHGIDLSAAAIERARDNAKGSKSFSYEVADAAALPLPDQSFSHVLGGCNFGFIADREQSLDEAHRILRPGGYLCVSAFYYKQQPPASLLDRVSDAIGFRSDAQRDRDYWKSFFSRRFTLKREILHDLPLAGQRRVDKQARRSVYGNVPELRTAPAQVKDACYRRLREIRLVLDEHRQYQGLMIGVWQAKP